MVINHDQVGQYYIHFNNNIPLIVDTGAVHTSVDASHLADLCGCDVTLLKAAVLVQGCELNATNASLDSMRLYGITWSNVLLGNRLYDYMSIVTNPFGRCADLLGMDVLSNSGLRKDRDAASLDIVLPAKLQTRYPVFRKELPTFKDALLTITSKMLHDRFSKETLEVFVNERSMSVNDMRKALRDVVSKLQGVSPEDVCNWSIAVGMDKSTPFKSMVLMYCLVH